MSSPQVQKRILVADDHVLVAEGVESLLRTAGYPVVRVDTAERLLRQVQSDGFTLVISDISMQQSNGLDAMRQLYATGRQVPFIFLTMHADPWLARDALRAGAMGYVLKSAAGEELLRAVEEVIAGRHYVSRHAGGTGHRRRLVPHAITHRQAAADPEPGGIGSALEADRILTWNLCTHGGIAQICVDAGVRRARNHRAGAPCTRAWPGRKRHAPLVAISGEAAAA
ncbi:response regulator transcription factor [Stenotrophomonas sp. PS02298]|uniref:response regulator n=1 Tax=Stenotrophomonas sp. PS02298 TaxID=2991424 RepID=UPI00249C97A1|nr:response regulator transcription factor [Stenotrophomonas sp. PS02298]